ncbi:MAG: hypothetical protein K2J55_03355 [Eubacterium sp.]|nr:hypothetical protein [Eubacterium sp.]
MHKNNLPLSFGNALAKNEHAMKQFEMLSDYQKQAVINKTRKINSEYEMDCFVDYFSNGSLNI